MMSYSPGGQKTLDLGPFVVIEDMTRDGNGAHLLGPDLVVLSLQPKEGDWAARYRGAVAKGEFYPIGLELRRDDRTGLFVSRVMRAPFSASNATPPDIVFITPRG
jgi:hypothetical protein